MAGFSVLPKPLFQKIPPPKVIFSKSKKIKLMEKWGDMKTASLGKIKQLTQTE